FMGCEIGQFIEWNEEQELDWNLLEFDAHRQHKCFVEKLNKIYKKYRPLWELDTTWDGFDWAALDDDNNNIISFFRKDRDGNSILAVSNFSSVSQSGYKIGVPNKGVYEEIFSTDQKEFGGKGIANGKVKTQTGKMHGQNQHISLDIPAFSTTYFYKKAGKKKSTNK
ncbi:MAG: alpha amylase C-terminal domain-containing protein, partial [Clostridia bacterium]|nr:alpha amylase C-terminal domain-containing protein [Clostridia bacterium]